MRFCFSTLLLFSGDLEQKSNRLNLPVNFVIENNAEIDHDGVPLVQKAVIRCGLALHTNDF